MPEIKVIVAGANPVMRMRLVKAMQAGNDLRVIAEATDLPETYTRAEAMEPNVILVARDLTLLPEFSLMKSLFRALNCRWITVDHRVGATVVGSIADESGLAPMDTAQSPEEICRQVVAASKLIQPQVQITPARVAVPAMPMRAGKIILMGSSTGGIDALLAVLSAMPADCPPIALVQHTGQGFSESLIRLLDRRSTVSVQAATTGMELRPGHVCVAAGSPGHLRLRPGNPVRVSLDQGPLISGHLPSVDALFRSAVPMASQVVAVLLTGMGRDGAEGLLELRRAGAVTIGQNEATSVVYGMPKAAWDLGAVQHQVGLGDVAATILRACAALGRRTAGENMTVLTDGKLTFVVQGTYYVSSHPEAQLSTVLGSCISVCLFDPAAAIGGMNHFLLAAGRGEDSGHIRFGVNAMEKLINELLKSGAVRSRLQAKLFGARACLPI